MLNQDQIGAVVDCISNALLLTLQQYKSIPETINVIESIKTPEGLLVHITRASVEVKNSLMILHSLYTGNHVKTTQNGELQIHEFDMQNNHVPLDLHLLNSDFTKVDLVDFGSEMINTSLKTLQAHIDQQRIYEPPLPPDPEDDEDKPLPSPKNNHNSDQPWNEYIFGEVCAGVTDGVKGIIFPFLHPLQFIENTVEAALHPIDTVRNVADHAIKHPIRFSTSMATSYGISKLATNLVSPKAPSSGPGPTNNPISNARPITPIGSGADPILSNFDPLVENVNKINVKSGPLLKPPVSHYRPPGGLYGPVPGHDLPTHGLNQPLPRYVPPAANLPRAATFTPAHNLARQMAHALNASNTFINTAENLRQNDFDEINILLKSAMLSKAEIYQATKDVNAALAKLKLR